MKLNQQTMSLTDYLESEASEVLPNNSERYMLLDLSIHNSALSADITSNSNKLGNYISDYLRSNNANVGFGGYNEVRALYQRSDIFNAESAEERNIHIGLDIWAPAGTPILAALDGIVHSFNFNEGKGNYGPTIILQHTYANTTFFTLYGHLDSDSLQHIEKGAQISKGMQIAVLGNESVNGDYPAHLHFQIIEDIKQYSGDYPGVCSQNDREYFLKNCPDPNLLLKLKSQ